MMKRLTGLFVLLLMAAALTACAAQPVETSPTAPAAGTQATGVAAEPTPSLTTEPFASPSAAAPTENAATESPAAAGETIVFTLSPGEGMARYRVREQLVNLSLPNDAIGETDQISGSVTIRPDGTIDTSTSRFEVDLSTLVSDQSRRDNFLRNNVLQTSQFPTAVFVPKSVNGLTLPPSGNGEMQFQLVGDLTLRDVTREVTWDVTGTLQNGQGTGQAVTQFTFADFSLTQPRVPVVLSIEDQITLEVDGTVRASE